MAKDRMTRAAELAEEAREVVAARDTPQVEEEVGAEA